jgi:hypothetical protein
MRRRSAHMGPPGTVRPPNLEVISSHFYDFLHGSEVTNLGVNDVGVHERGERFLESLIDLAP